MKAFLKNTLLVCASLSLVYGLLEWKALSLFFRILPPITYPLLDAGIPPLLQHSKQSLIPHHYIALAGDSYAFGLGDEYYHNAGHRAARYGSTAALHRLTQRDVLSFGVGGNGSIAAYVTEPLSNLAYWQASARVTIEAPETMLLYFYEGNDLNDNEEYLRKASKKYSPFNTTRATNSAYFQSYIRAIALQQNGFYQTAQQLRWSDELYLGKFMLRASAIIGAQLSTKIIAIFSPAEAAAPTTRSPLNPPGRFEWQEPGNINRAQIQGKIQQLPDRLQGPSMDLTIAEKQLALLSFREALRFVKRELPQTRLLVVYLPSVISCYDMVSPQASLQSHARRQQFEFPLAAVQKQSEWMAAAIAEQSRIEGVTFIDTRPALQAAARQAPLHGPLDWNHFNARGYQVLSEAIVPSLQQAQR